MPVIDAERLIEERVAAIRNYHAGCGIQKSELDLSGGIDSAVVACLLKMALGPHNVILLHSKFSTNPVQTDRAKALAKALGVPLLDCDFGDIYDQVIRRILEAATEACYSQVEIGDRLAKDRTILGSIRSTLRAPLGRAANRLLGGGIRHGTGNECEDRFLRFYQKGGDGEVDTNPIAMLSKTETYQLAFALGKRLGPAVDQAMRPIIEALPSPDLWGVGDAHADEAELASWTGVKFTYGRINAETGAITSIGTIERVARFIDDAPYWFEDAMPPAREEVFLTRAYEHQAFAGMGEADVRAYLLAARKVERLTRHKLNPNCPALGSRSDLVAEGILTNVLPMDSELT